VLYPILGRMLEEGWVHDGWEDRAEIVDKRPARRYYELTAKGKAELGAILDDARSDVRFGALVARLA
jgi:PadR family transcriptional regulator PadR